MTLPLITVDSILSWNPCEEYDRAKLASGLGDGEFNAIHILNSGLPLQDKLWGIVRPECIGEEGVAAVDEWVIGQFDQITARTVEGENCKAHWPRPGAFQRASTLAELMRYEMGGEAAFISGLQSILEGV